MEDRVGSRWSMRNMHQNETGWRLSFKMLEHNERDSEGDLNDCSAVFGWWYVGLTLYPLMIYSTSSVSNADAPVLRVCYPATKDDKLGQRVGGLQDYM